MPELRLPVRRGRRRVVLWLVVGLGLLIFFISPLVGLLAEWPWFSALGYERVFATRLVASFTLGVLAGGVAFAFLYANLRFGQRGIVRNPVVMQASAQTPAVDVTRLVRRLALPTALAFALFLALAISTGWMPVLQFLHQTPFGVKDPVFGRDIAYYVFTLPIVTGVLAILTVLVTLSLLACGALYTLRRDVVFYRRTVTIEPSARLHLGLLIAAMFVLTALRIYFVRLPGTLYSTTGPLFGASFADLHGKLIGLRIAGVAAILGAGLVFAGFRHVGTRQVPRRRPHRSSTPRRRRARLAYAQADRRRRPGDFRSQLPRRQHIRRGRRPHPTGWRFSPHRGEVVVLPERGAPPRRRSAGPRPRAERNPYHRRGRHAPQQGMPFPGPIESLRAHRCDRNSPAAPQQSRLGNRRAAPHARRPAPRCADRPALPRAVRVSVHRSE